MTSQKSWLLEENKNFDRVRKVAKRAKFFDVLHKTDLRAVQRELSELGYKSADRADLKSLYRECYYLLNAVLPCHETIIATDQDGIIVEPDFTFVPAIFAQGRSLTFGSVGLLLLTRKIIVYAVKE
ncbi:MAG: hypothetical protein HY225_03215 [Candidatus Vogelbacteria bacterium]|nr:hypothetical protein [Candidatus Vogelbacteria bacterium]